MFKPAVRQSQFLRIALTGASGTGKTFSALQLAQGLGSRIAVIDTENGSSSLYSGVCDYDVANLIPPYSPARYIELLKEAQASYDVVIIDSLSHVWDGEGGLLDAHDKMGGGFNTWAKIKPMQSELINGILTAQCHIIATFRVKSEYARVSDEKGREQIKKVGLTTISPKDIEYDYTLVLRLHDDHRATVEKSRILSVSDGNTVNLWSETRSEILTPAHGTELVTWLETGQSYDLVKIKEMLSAAKTNDEITVIWQGITPPVPKSHVQYRDIVTIFQEAKKRVT